MKVLSRQRPEEQIVVGSRCIGGACHGGGDGSSTAESLLQGATSPHLDNSLEQQRRSFSRASSRRETSVSATGCKTFTVRAKPEPHDRTDELDRQISSTLRKALASHLPSIEDHQVPACKPHLRNQFYVTWPIHELEDV